MNLFARVMMRAPWWVHLGVAALIAYVGVSLNSSAARDEALLVEALAAEPPALVGISALDRQRDLAAFDEGVVRAQVDDTYNTRLVKRTNGITTDETLMQAIFAQDADLSTSVVLGVILVDASLEEDYLAWMLDNLQDFGERGLIHDIHGLVETSHSKASHARDVLREDGLTLAPNMVYITPFVEGRETVLSAEAAQDRQAQLIILGIAALFLLIAAGKFRAQRKRRKSQGSAPTAPVPGAPTPGPGGAAALSVPDHAKISEAAFANPLQRPGGGPAKQTESTSFRETTQIPRPGHELTAGPKASRAAALLQKQKMRAEAQELAAQGATQASVQQSPRAFDRASGTTRPPAMTARPLGFREKMKQDPFEKLARQMGT